MSSDDNGMPDDGINPTLTPVDTGAGSGGGTPSGLTRSLYATSEADSSGSQVLVGEVLGFEVAFIVAAGTTREVTLLESLPDGLAYVPGSATLARTFDTGLSAARDPGGINGEPAGSFVPLLDGSEVLIAGDGLTRGDDQFTISYRARVDAAVSFGALLENSAELDYSGLPGAVIGERAVIAAGTPAGSVIENQGVVDSDQTVPEPTDADGVDGNGDQPTRTPVGGGGGGAALYAQKLAEWLDDADSSGSISPGDRMRYQFILSNTGDQTLTGVRLDDSVPAGLTPLPATEQVGGSGNSAAVTGRDLLVQVPVLAAGQQVSASLEVQIDSPLYDANGDPADGSQPTRFTAADGAAPASQPDVEKRWSLAADADGDGAPGPGDTLEFRILVAHGGPGPIDDLRLEDTIPTGTSLVVGSVHSSRGIVVAEDPLQVNVGSLAPGASVEVALRVRVDAVPPSALVLNQARVSGGNIQPEPSDDDADDGNGLDPVRVPIGQITGLVFSDQNRNGLRDAGEGVVAGAPVALYQAAGGLVASLQSAADGRYRFAGLAPGQYTVVETDLEGYISSTPNSVSASLLASQSATVDFGDVYGGSVFRGGDGDGVRGGGEVGLGGVTVRLLDAGGAVYAATVTDAAGDFLFEGVVPGSYRASAGDLDGYASTTPNAVALTLLGGGSASALFGDHLPLEVFGVPFDPRLLALAALVLAWLGMRAVLGGRAGAAGPCRRR